MHKYSTKRSDDWPGNLTNGTNLLDVVWFHDYIKKSTDLNFSYRSSIAKIDRNKTLPLIRSKRFVVNVRACIIALD